MGSFNILLPPQLEQWVQDKVASGMFRDPSEVICEALRNFDTNKTLIEELIGLRFGRELALGIQQANHNEFLTQTFDEIIAEADGLG